MDFTFLVPAQPGSPGQRTVKRVCVYVRGFITATLLILCNILVGFFLCFLFLLDIVTMLIVYNLSEAYMKKFM